MNTTYQVNRPDWRNPEKGNPWYDIAEARPRGKARLRDDAEPDEAFITVDEDGKLDFDRQMVEFEAYEEENNA